MKLTSQSALGMLKGNICLERFFLSVKKKDYFQWNLKAMSLSTHWGLREDISLLEPWSSSNNSHAQHPFEKLYALINVYILPNDSTGNESSSQIQSVLFPLFLLLASKAPVFLHFIMIMYKSKTTHLEFDLFFHK